MQLKRVDNSNPAPVVEPQTPELIVLVGPPSSGTLSLMKSMLPIESCLTRKIFFTGKSTRSRTEYSFAEHINQDTLKTVAKCLAAAKAALLSGKSVVVDSTNVDKKTRQQWIKLAQGCNITNVR